MKTILPTSFLVVVLFLTSNAQVYIPDTNFKNALLTNNINIDKDFNGTIDLTEATQTETIEIPANGGTIVDFSGLEKFTNLKYFTCRKSYAETLNISTLTKLNTLIFTNSNLASIDLSSNILLEFLAVTSNKLTSLDISSNTNLITLEFEKNQIKNIDLNKNDKITTLICTENNLELLDVSSITNLISLYCFDNANLSQICVNNSQMQNIPIDWIKNQNTQFSTSCGTVSGLENDLIPTTKQLLRIITPLGQEIKPEQAIEGILIYQYNDGSTEKVFHEK